MKHSSNRKVSVGLKQDEIMYLNHALMLQYTPEMSREEEEKFGKLVKKLFCKLGALEAMNAAIRKEAHV